MDLWIRSQDKRTLIKIDRVDVDGNSIIVWQNNYNCDEIYLGSYKTKERALEVLDEIQAFLIIGDSDFDKEGVCGIYHNVVASKQVIIYEMPKE